MPTFKSCELIHDLQEQTESLLHNAVTKWQSHPPAILLHKQEETVWSATQCLMHLNSYGHYYLPAIQKSIEEAEKKHWHAADTFKPSFIGNWFTELMKPQGEAQAIKKMKSPKAHTPIKNENSGEVLAEFIGQQKTLLKLLKRSRDTDLRKAKITVSISRFIKLPLGDTLRFFIAHNERHIIQAEKAMANALENASSA